MEGECLPVASDRSRRDHWRLRALSRSNVCLRQHRMLSSFQCTPSTLAIPTAPFNLNSVYFKRRDP